MWSAVCPLHRAVLLPKRFCSLHNLNFYIRYRLKRKLSHALRMIGIRVNRQTQIITPLLSVISGTNRRQLCLTKPLYLVRSNENWFLNNTDHLTRSQSLPLHVVLSCGLVLSYYFRNEEQIRNDISPRGVKVNTVWSST